ncbi:MAG: hypothetical protein AAF269_17170 [Pseudomonadota bacterium]
MIDEETNSLQRVARVWLTFVLFGGLIGLIVSLALVFGFGQSETVSAITGLVIGIPVGFGSANWLPTRRLAATLFRVLGFIEWHLK